MKYEMIKKYIAHICMQYGLNISIHSRSGALNSIIYEFPEINIHSGAFCVYIKSHPEMWDKCIKNQGKIYEKLEKNGYKMFFGSCHAGVGEYIFPIHDGKTLLGFISAGKYIGSREKMLHTVEKYMLNKQETEESFFKNLSSDIPDAELAETILFPISAMLICALSENPPELCSASESLVNNALAYIHRNFASKISLKTAADYCHCSPRTLSALFMNRCGVSVGKYIERLRMEKAEKLLCETSLSITEISFLCGYSDSNYFSARFSKHFGKAPSDLRIK